MSFFLFEWARIALVSEAHLKAAQPSKQQTHDRTALPRQHRVTCCIWTNERASFLYPEKGFPDRSVVICETLVLGRLCCVIDDSLSFTNGCSIKCLYVCHRLLMLTAFWVSIQSFF